MILKNFITFEGMDACGKSTAIEKAKDYLEAKGFEVILTREPGGTELGENLRNIIKEKDMCLSTEINLLNAIRLEHLHQKIIPALNKNKIVLCDRYIDSTLVYQILAVEEERLEKERDLLLEYKKPLQEIRKKLLLSTLKQIKNFNIYYPEKTFFFDVSVENSIIRRTERNEKIDKFENKKLEDLNNIRHAYLELIRKDDAFISKTQNRFITIDSNQKKEKVIEDMILKLDDLFDIKNDKIFKMKIK